jgi:hypothetical protein
MSQPHTCEYCKNSIPRAADRCPHCAKPGYYPNVQDAEDPAEVAALQVRYLKAKADSEKRGADLALQSFEDYLESSVAILVRPAGELLRLATSDDEIYATYYQLLGAGLKSHGSDKISSLRAIVDEALFPGYKENIRFAALALDEVGLSNYGDCSVILRTQMIAHRASVFEENSLLSSRHMDVRLGQANELPLGYRAPWSNRAGLCVSKLSPHIDSATPDSQYSSILLRSGATSASDDFIEVHIWGSITARAFQQVTLTHGSKSYQRVIVKALKEKFENAGVSVKVK